MSSYKIFVDMDGVIIDFVGAVIDRLNNATNNKHNPAKLQKHIDKATESIGRSYFIPTDINMNENWNTKVRDLMFYLIKDDVSFWENLKWTKDGKKLWSFLSRFDPYILSSPTDEACKEGKRRWVSENLHVADDKVFLEREKYLFAKEKNGTPNILIDDYIKNTNPFRKHGGLAILHLNTRRTIKKLKELLGS